MGNCVAAFQDGFMQPTEDKLDEISPGCFVQKKISANTCCWVEITSINDSGYVGLAHPSLLEGSENEAISEGEEIFLKREQITALGCDRFCFC